MARIMYYNLIGKLVIPVANVEEWVTGFGHRVDLTEIGPIMVSTVFLGIDHNLFAEGEAPILFETMMYLNDPDAKAALTVADRPAEFLDYLQRCGTWDEAEQQHSKAVEYAKEILANADAWQSRGN